VNRLLLGGLIAATLPGCAFFAPLPKKIWEDQYRGLDQLPPGDGRLQALASITESAAHDGDAAAVRRFLKDFIGHPKHDDIAARCVAALAGRAQLGGDIDPRIAMADADDIAALIADPGKRTEVLGKIHPKPKPEPVLEPESAPPAVPKLPGETPPPELPDDARRPR
jgi:hypothetical protein